MNIEIITPHGLILNKKVDSVTAPGTAGQFQVLKGHANLMAKLEIGFLKIEYDNTTEYYSCNGGVFEIDDNKINILTESSEYYRDIDVARAEKALERAQKRLKEKEKSTDLLKAEIALNRAINRLKISQFK